MGESIPAWVGVLSIPSPWLANDRADECAGDPGWINARFSRRSLEDPDYLGMLLTTSADMKKECKTAHAQATENKIKALHILMIPVEGEAGRRLSSAERRSPPVNVLHRRPLGIDLSSHTNTRSVSWLGSVSTGTHPRTKGTRYFTGGYR
jgi:hypothetical protein